MKVNCDNCHKNFDSKKIKLKEKKITNEIIQISYKCPKCKFTYIVGYKDKEIIENINRIRELSKQLVEGEQQAALKIHNLKMRNNELNCRYKVLFKGTH